MYEVDSPVVQYLYTVGRVRRARSQPVGVQITSTRCRIFVGQACQEEERDYYICKELSGLCPGTPLSVPDLLAIFTQPTRVLDLMYPAGVPQQDVLEPDPRSVLSIEEEFEQMLDEAFLEERSTVVVLSQEGSSATRSSALETGRAPPRGTDEDSDDGLSSAFVGVVFTEDSLSGLEPRRGETGSALRRATQPAAPSARRQRPKAEQEGRHAKLRSGKLGEKQVCVFATALPSVMRLTMSHCVVPIWLCRSIIVLESCLD